MGTFGKAPMDVQSQKELAKDLYKYQNYKSAIIPQKVSSRIYAETSIIGFHSMLRRYLATGVKDLQRASEEFYNEIDKLRNIHFSILRPTQQEQARPFVEKKRKNKGVKIVKAAIQETQKAVSKPISENAVKLSVRARNEQDKNTFLALKLEDKYQTFENDSEIKGFLKAYQDINKEVKFEKVRITVETL